MNVRLEELQGSLEHLEDRVNKKDRELAQAHEDIN